LIDWSYSNGTILKSLTEFLRIWLKQRRSEGKASLTRIRSRKGKPKEASILLARLAAWRLAKASHLSANEVEDRLKPLLKKNGIVGLQGSLGRWCAEIEWIVPVAQNRVLSNGAQNPIRC
jgi:hypothetical protein